MLNLGMEYVWLDVLCLRRHGKQENKCLHGEEWKTDVPTGSPQLWLNQAWTLQEISRKWMIGGTTVVEQDHKAMLDRIHEHLGTLVNTVHRVDNVFNLLVRLRKCKSEHAVGHVAALIFPLWSKAIPTYNATQSFKDLWLAVRTKHRGDTFFLYPRPGSEQVWRPLWNQVITERRLLTGKGRVQGLDTDDSKGPLQQGKLVIKGDTGTLHSLEIIAAHPYATPDDSYTLIASGWKSGTRVPSTEIYWVAGRRLPEWKFEKIAVFTMTDVKEDRGYDEGVFISFLSTNYRMPDGQCADLTDCQHDDQGALLSQAKVTQHRTNIHATRLYIIGSPRQCGLLSPLLSITKKRKEETMKGERWVNTPAVLRPVLLPSFFPVLQLAHSIDLPTLRLFSKHQHFPLLSIYGHVTRSSKWHIIFWTDGNEASVGTSCNR
ncbi:hypothetical protein EV421DRAFT_1981201 [Armillaria borealis]|uniref:Heterokaryon incompatibility domain-containing protein n=1 Tax=Armillaria borealis TaxID=47425 RepID=A0AA39J7G0_9AGAR|nr:hypothetical protein EV421DRAFT_1981201 [Armillaria borealis]